MIFLRPNSEIKVFIADDSLIVREHLVTLLDELAGVEIVGQAENVAEAIRGIRTLQPDVVILDMRLPDGSGIDVLQNIKQDEAAPMVIILTNYPYPGYRQKCLQAGADFFLDKSTEFDQIPKLFELLKQGAGSDRTN
ncbi:MAG: two-component system response regulator [Chloroflexota bacterium]|nr:MAG: two-component system response regulator [Chloroflexota bacterium]